MTEEHSILIRQMARLTERVAILEGRPPVLHIQAPPSEYQKLTEKSIAKISDIMGAVCKVWGIEKVEVLSGRGSKELWPPKFCIYHICKKRTAASFPFIGQRMRKDHTTVMHGMRRADELLKTDKVFAEKYSQALALIDGVAA